MLNIRYAQEGDKAFWYSLDAELPEAEFLNKVRDQRAYVMLDNGTPIGLLRYSMFWDTIPFCNLIHVEERSQRRGAGTMLLDRWENDMRRRGHGLVLTSTQADENAQHFYRKRGYQDCGGIVFNNPGYRQPMELIMAKNIR